MLYNGVPVMVFEQKGIHHPPPGAIAGTPLCSIQINTGKNMENKIIDAGDVARERFFKFLDEKLKEVSYHFIEESEMEQTKALNIAAALGDEAHNLCDYMVPTITPGIQIIASTPYLADLRTLSEKRLKRMIPALYGKFDICIIDCPPTYDNIVLNAVNASNFTITPVLKDMFSFNAAAFFAGVLPRDVEGFENWFVLLNGFDKRYEGAKSGRQHDFLELYRKEGFSLTPAETWLPWTNHIHLLVDYHKKLTCIKGTMGAVYNPDLHKAIAALAGCFFDEELNIAEAF